MRVTGTCFLAYEPAPNFNRLRVMGLHAQRVISHNQSTYWMGNTFYSHAYLGVALDVYRVHGFPILYDSLNDIALPLWSATNNWQATTKTFSEPVFRAWIKEYIRYMALPGLDYRICWGNEPDASGSIYLGDEANFRARYQMVAQAVSELQADPTFTGRIKLGAGGWCQNWTRAAHFAQWCDTNNVRLDFMDLHIYEDPAKLTTATTAIRAKSGVPLVILESGADWRTNSTVTPAAQKAWFAAMSSACDASGIAAWHLLRSVGAADVAPMSMIGAVGMLTPIGQMVAG